MTEPDRQPVGTPFYRRFRPRHGEFVVIALIAAFVVGALGYGLYIVTRISTRYEPLAEAAHGILFEVTAAHLWLEEGADTDMSGSRSAERARLHLARARAFLDAIRHGGQTPGGDRVAAVVDPALARQLARMDTLLSSFEALAREHFPATRSRPWPGLAAATDSVYDALTRVAAKVHTQAQTAMDRSLRTFRHDLLALLLASLVLGVVAVTYVRRAETRKAADRAALEREIGERRHAQEGLDRAQAIAHLGHWEWDPHGGAVTFSNEMLRIMGVPRERMRGGYAGLLAAVHPDDRPALEAHVHALRAGAEPAPFTHRMLRPDGTLRHVRAQLGLAGEGDRQRVVGTVRDITTGTEAQAAAAASEARYQHLFNHMAQGMVVYDDQVNVTAVNPAAARMLGTTREQLTGASLKDPLFSAQREDGSTVGYDDCPVIVALRDRVPVVGEVLGITPAAGGPPTWVLLDAVPQIDDGPRPVEVHVTLTDITEQRRLEEEYRHARRMEALGTLVGGIAHDFNNILTSLQGSLHLARRRLGDNNAVLEKLDIAERLGQRAADMVAQLLAFSRQRKVALGLCDLTAVVRDAVTAARAGMPERIAIQGVLPEAALTVRGDANLLQQVLVNLLFNARDALEGRARPVIAVTLGVIDATPALRRPHPDLPGGRLALIAVSDNGCGIPQDHMEKLFEPFFTTKEVGRGTGLGLAMCYGTVRAHGGVMEVDSREGEGTTFRVLLPLAAVAKAELPAPDPAQVPRAHPGETILLADDEELVRLTAREVLRDLGYEVLDAADGETACTLFDGDPGRVTLALVDVVMPRLGGVEAVRRMRARRPDLPVIFTTGFDRGSVLADAEAWQPVVVLSKPYPMARIGWQVRALIDGERGPASPPSPPEPPKTAPDKRQKKSATRPLSQGGRRC
ncbi:MAG: PAS domain S-box protein [Nitrospirae bacterium]|nr:PAS domain S-box protein [Nitrospirota bacterium]